MKPVLLFCIVAAMISSAAQGAAPDVSWSAWRNAGASPEGELVGESLKLENVGAQPKTFRLLVLPQPGITSPAYAMSGQLKYEGVAGTGYLEMLNRFPGDKVYFTRTLAAFGEMRGIQGSSDWRPFSLPFYVRDDSGWLDDRPEALEVNLVLPGKGTVDVGPMRLAMLDAGENQTKAWWGPRAVGALGGAYGGILGLLGGLTGILAARGKARAFVLSTYWGLLGIGLCLLAFGIFAAVSRQPTAVYGPLLFTGGLTSLLSLTLLPVVRRSYQARELRRMSAADA